MSLFSPIGAVQVLTSNKKPPWVIMQFLLSFSVDINGPATPAIGHFALPPLPTFPNMCCSRPWPTLVACRL